MSKPRRDNQYLADILEAIRRILDYTQDLTYDGFLRSPMIQDAVLRNLQVVGEATNKLSSTLQANYPDMPWQVMAGMRDKIVHDYFGIDYQVVWDVARGDLPQLMLQVETILREVAGDEAD